MIALLLALAAVLPPIAPIPEDEQSLLELFEARASASDTAGIDELFRSRPFEVFYLVDGYLEAWLGLEEVPSAERAVDPELPLRLARLAAERGDHVLSGDALSRYTAAWEGWDADGRKAFHEGRAAFREGRAAQAEKRYDDARAAYEKSLYLLEPLGDLVGTARAEQALGDLAVGQKRLEAAILHHQRSRDTLYELRHPAALRSCRALGMLYEMNGNLTAARENLETMLAAAKEAGRDTDTTGVRESLARICAALGDDEAAGRYRESLTTPSDDP